MNNIPIIWDWIDMIIMSMRIYSSTSSHRARLMTCYLYMPNELLVYTWAILSDFAWLKNQIPNQRSWNGEMQGRLVLKSTSRTPMNCKFERIESDAVRAHTRLLNVQNKLLRVKLPLATAAMSCSLQVLLRSQPFLKDLNLHHKSFWSSCLEPVKLK